LARHTPPEPSRYSRAFASDPRKGGQRRQINVDVPATLHAAVTAKAAREGVSVRSLVLTYLQDWSSRS
jgi:predicted HicB family RNase H-like nuclease